MLLSLFLVTAAAPVGTIQPDPLAYPSHLSLRCPWAHFDCDTKSLTPTCIPFSAVRNCVRDCPNGADEWCGVGQVLCDSSSRNFKCGQCVAFAEQNQKCSERRWLHMCSDPRAIRCASTVNCVLPQWLQDGRDDCGDGSDEDPCGRGIVPCPTSREESTTDIPYLLENVTDISVDNSTLPATDFPEQCETGEYRCGSGECIAGKLVLDEKKDCSDGSDEDYCIRFGSECRMDSRPCSYQPDIASFGCGCPRGNTRTEEGMCIPK